MLRCAVLRTPVPGPVPCMPHGRRRGRLGSAAVHGQRRDHARDEVALLRWLGRSAQTALAHDLNHSLNVLALRIATLRADPRLSESRHTLESLSGLVEQAAGTVSRLQDLARRRRDRPAEGIDLSAVLLGAIEMARTDLDGQGGRVRIAADVPPLPLVRGTAAELTHLFSDLLLNARDAMPAGGTVEVRGREHHRAVEV